MNVLKLSGKNDKAKIALKNTIKNDNVFYYISL